MKYRTRTFYSETQKAMMWDRWRQGETLHSIARLFDRHHGSVRGILAPTGGIRPARKVRSDRVLSLSEREEISRGSSPVARCARSLRQCVAHHPPSVDRSGATEAARTTGQAKRTRRLGIGGLRSHSN
jgi:hypothetical protein